MSVEQSRKCSQALMIRASEIDSETFCFIRSTPEPASVNHSSRDAQLCSSIFSKQSSTLVPGSVSAGPGAWSMI